MSLLQPFFTTLSNAEISLGAVLLFSIKSLCCILFLTPSNAEGSLETIPRSTTVSIAVLLSNTLKRYSLKVVLLFNTTIAALLSNTV